MNYNSVDDHLVETFNICSKARRAQTWSPAISDRGPPPLSILVPVEMRFLVATDNLANTPLWPSVQALSTRH